jgi:hypothetical protein
MMPSNDVFAALAFSSFNHLQDFARSNSPKSSMAEALENIYHGCFESERWQYAWVSSIANLNANSSFLVSSLTHRGLPVQTF